MEKNFTQEMSMDFTQKEIAHVIKEYGRKQVSIPFTLKRMGELGRPARQAWRGAGATGWLRTRQTSG